MCQGTLWCKMFNLQSMDLGGEIMDFTILVLWVICLMIILIYKDFKLNDKISELNSVIDGMEKRLENLRIAKKNEVD